MERLTLPKDGFCGLYHRAPEPLRAERAVIVLGGSEGNENVPLNIGARFAERGVTALGVCYWNAEGLPHELSRVPLDPFEKAIDYLEAEGYREIYIYGISEGAKTALLCAALMPRLKGVAALSPMHCIWNGQSSGNGIFSKKFYDTCEFTYKGQDFPYMSARVRYLPGIAHLLFQQQLNLAYIYEKPLENFDEATAIPVEKINGDILFIYPKQDLMWPSHDSVKYMLKRLKDKHFAHRVHALEFEKASHIMVPLNSPILRLFKIERRFPDACRQSREDAFEETIAWLAADSKNRPDQLEHGKQRA